MNKLTRLTILVIVLAGLTLVTGIAYASARIVSQPAAQDYSALKISLNAQDILGNNSSHASTSEKSSSSNNTSSEIRNNSAGEDSSSTSLDDNGDEIEIVGVVEDLTTDMIVISSTVIAINSSTELEDEIAVGDMVKVHAFTADDGTLTAREIELFEDEQDDDGDDDHDTTVITGTVESLTSDFITVSGIIIAITSSTEFEDDISVGDEVKVEVFTADDGSLIAHEIELFFSDDDAGEDDDSEGDDSSGEDDSDSDDSDSDEDDSDSDDSDSDEGNSDSDNSDSDEDDSDSDDSDSDDDDHEDDDSDDHDDDDDHEDDDDESDNDD